MSGFGKALGSKLAFILVVAAFLVAFWVLNYSRSPHTRLEHFHFSRSEGQTAKGLGVPPSDDMKVDFPLSRHRDRIIRAVEITRSFRHGVERWGFKI